MNKLTQDWILGFVWGIGTISDSRLIIRYHNKELLEKITKILKTQAKPYHPTKNKTAIRFSLNHPFAKQLLSLGWSGRFNKERSYPKGEFNKLEFIRGYCYTKITIDIWKHKNRKGEIIESPRLRIWGSKDIVENIDQFFVVNLKTTSKKIQFHKSKTQDKYLGNCYYVQYLSKKEVPLILELINPV